jgi:hypothetical protein
MAACRVWMCAGSNVQSWMSPSNSTRYEDSSPAVTNTLPRLLISMALPDEHITRMHSPQVDEVLWVATPLTDPSVLEYIIPRALLRWVSSVGESGVVVTDGVVVTLGWHAVHTVVFVVGLHLLWYQPSHLS